MKPSFSDPRSKDHARARRKTHEELDQKARDRKRQRKRRGHVPDSRATDGDTTSDSRGQSIPKDPCIGSKTPIPLGVAEKITKQHKPKSEKPVLSPQARLELLGTDERLDALLEHLEVGETPSTGRQSWVDVRLDRIDELIQKLGPSYDDDEKEEEDEEQEDMIRLPRSN